MIKEAIGTGVTTEEAIEAAKKALGAPWDADVQVKITKAPQKKILGLFGGSLAEAKAFYEIPDEKPAAKEKEKTNENKKVATESKPQKVEVKKTVADKQESDRTVGDASLKAKAYIENVLNGMGVTDFGITAEEDNEGVYVQLECGSDYGYIIGRRGETLDAIQYLTRLVINKGKDGYKRVSINAGNYREKREETLRELAKKNAARVKKYGRNVVLDPMNPYERRIIHTTIQDIEGVDSHSVGSESDRKVVITLAEGFKATNPSSGRNRRGGYNRKKESTTDVVPTREPRSDSAGVNLYGKIEPKAKEE